MNSSCLCQDSCEIDVEHPPPEARPGHPLPAGAPQLSTRCCRCWRQEALQAPFPGCPHLTHRVCRSSTTALRLSPNNQGNSLKHKSLLTAATLPALQLNLKWGLQLYWGGPCWDQMTPVFCQSHMPFCCVSCLLMSPCCCYWHPASSKLFS